MKLKIILKNLIRHKWSSLLILSVFLVSTFVLYWTFGFANLVTQLIPESNRDSYGDITLLTEYFEKQKVEKILSSIGAEKIAIEREVRTILDYPQDPSKSDMIGLIELTEENTKRLNRYIRPIKGRLPEGENEIVITESYKKGIYNIGDSIFLTTSTPDKIVNTKNYKIVGISKSSGFKAYGNAFIITEKAMTSLINSSNHANLISIFTKDFNNKEAVNKIFARAKQLLKENNIDVKNSFTAIEQTEKIILFAVLFQAIKFITMLIFFPLIGAVVAAVVSMYAFRRRKELWTYSALGMNNSGIIKIMLNEYFILAVLGTILGILAGAITSYISKAGNVWLTFSYSFVCPFYTAITSADIITIIVFIVLSVVVWALLPIKKIVKAVPFSY